MHAIIYNYIQILNWLIESGEIMECKKVGLLLMVVMLVVATVPYSTVAMRQIPLSNIMFAGEMNDTCVGDGRRCHGDGLCCANFVCKDNVCRKKKGEEDGWWRFKKHGGMLLCFSWSVPSSSSSCACFLLSLFFPFKCCGLLSVDFHDMCLLSPVY